MLTVGGVTCHSTVLACTNGASVIKYEGFAFRQAGATVITTFNKQ